MDKFINEQNLMRFRSLISASTDAAQRKILIELLAAEEARFIELQHAAAKR